MESLKKYDLFEAAAPPIKVEKGWGHELWIVNISEYCGKILHMGAGKRMSWHYHKVKTETFYVLEGRCTLLVGSDDDIEAAREVILIVGDKAHIPQGMRHQLIALEDSKILEVSTPHAEKDSYRIQKGD